MLLNPTKWSLLVPVCNPTSQVALSSLSIAIGPAGLMTASILARMGRKPLVIDSGDHRSHEFGRADAFQSRYLRLPFPTSYNLEHLLQMHGTHAEPRPSY
jgi:hypothetical protein